MMVNFFFVDHWLCFLSIENKEQNNPLLIQSILEYTSMVNTHAVFVDVK